jgi:hypothetical protein
MANAFHTQMEDYAVISQLIAPREQPTSVAGYIKRDEEAPPQRGNPCVPRARLIPIVDGFMN